MRKSILLAIGALFAVAGIVSPASATLSDRDGTTWQPTSAVQVAKRGGGDRGGHRNGPYGSKNGGYNKNGTPARKDRRTDCDWRKPAGTVGACE